MADEKKSAGGSVTLLNKGQRHYDLGNDASGQPRRHAPGTTHTYSAEEAARMVTYRDLVDISKLPGQVDVKKLKVDNDKLLSENARLKEQLAALESRPSSKKKEPELEKVS